MGGPVEITGREMYDAIVQLTNQVSILTQSVDRLCTLSGDHEERLRLLEGRRWPLPKVRLIFTLASVALTAVIVGATVWSLP